MTTRVEPSRSIAVACHLLWWPGYASDTPHELAVLISSGNGAEMGENRQPLAAPALLVGRHIVCLLLTKGRKRTSREPDQKGGVVGAGAPINLSYRCQQRLRRDAACMERSHCRQVNLEVNGPTEHALPNVRNASGYCCHLRDVTCVYCFVRELRVDAGPHKPWARTPPRLVPLYF